MRNGDAQLAEVLGAGYVTLPGQTHMVKPKVLAPAVAARLGRGATRTATPAPAASVA